MGRGSPGPVDPSILAGRQKGGQKAEEVLPVNAFDFDAALGVDLVDALADEGRDLRPGLLQMLGQVHPKSGHPLGQPLVTALEGQGLDALLVGRQAAILALETLQSTFCTHVIRVFFCVFCP